MFVNVERINVNFPQNLLPRHVNPFSHYIRPFWRRDRQKTRKCILPKIYTNSEYCTAQTNSLHKLSSRQQFYTLMTNQQNYQHDDVRACECVLVTRVSRRLHTATVVTKLWHGMPARIWVTEHVSLFESWEGELGGRNEVFVALLALIAENEYRAKQNDLPRPDCESALITDAW